MSADEREHRAVTRPPRFAVMRRFEVPNFDNPTESYLIRWRIIETPWLSLYLHRMDGPDSRPTLHDHPWVFLSLVLRGGYVERRMNTRTMQPIEGNCVRWWNRVRTHDAHAITSLLRKPTWTLVFVGARRRTWGYWEPLSLGGWRWTEFDQHPHDREFKAAMAARAAADSGGHAPRGEGR